MFVIKESWLVTWKAIKGPIVPESLCRKARSIAKFSAVIPIATSHCWKNKPSVSPYPHTAVNPLFLTNRQPKQMIIITQFCRSTQSTGANSKAYSVLQTPVPCCVLGSMTGASFTWLFNFTLHSKPLCIGYLAVMCCRYQSQASFKWPWSCFEAHFSPRQQQLTSFIVTCSTQLPTASNCTTSLLCFSNLRCTSRLEQREPKLCLLLQRLCKQSEAGQVTKALIVKTTTTTDRQEAVQVSATQPPEFYHYCTPGKKHNHCSKGHFHLKECMPYSPSRAHFLPLLLSYTTRLCS